MDNPSLINIGKRSMNYIGMRISLAVKRATFSLKPRKGLNGLKIQNIQGLHCASIYITALKGFWDPLNHCHLQDLILTVIEGNENHHFARY